MTRKLAWATSSLLILTLAAAALATHSRFTDVTDQHPVDAIEWAAAQGITQGCDTDKFCPDQPLKRKHARVFIERFYDQILDADGDDQYANPDFTRADMMALLHTMTAPTTTVPITTEASTTTTQPSLTDTQIRQTLIDQSIAAYSGSCACPYNRARNGSRCGGRSAWSRPGGTSPLCYPSDVTQEMVDHYRQRYS